MNQHWNPVKSIDYLFSEKMATQLGNSLQDRVNEHSARENAAFTAAGKVADIQGKTLIKKFDAKELETMNKESGKEIKQFLDGGSFKEFPKDAREPENIGYPLIVSPHSCVSSFGPYNNWGGQDGGGAGETIFEPGAASRELRGRCYYGAAGSGHVWGGSGCWFRVGTTGTATLNIQFTTNGVSVLSSAFGYASTHVRFFGAVWGATENAWVDRGGFGIDLVNAHLWWFQSYDLEPRSLSGPFDTIAGGMYYCYGWFGMWTGVGGFASGGSRIATLMNPLTVCS